MRGHTCVTGSSAYGGCKLTAHGSSLTQAVNFPSAIPLLALPSLSAKAQYAPDYVTSPPVISSQALSIRSQHGPADRATLEAPRGLPVADTAYDIPSGHPPPEHKASPNVGSKFISTKPL